MSLPPQRSGRRLFNHRQHRNEKQFWKRQQIEPYQPVIVIGIDDEKNLFRLGIFYRAREYSWNSSAQPAMARPLGAFIHCLKEPPAELAVQASQFALTKQFSASCR